MGAPLPANESQRIAALLSCGVLDSPPEQAFDDVVQLASQLCQTPIALVTLVDRSRQWFKARVGLAVAETPRDVSFCAHAILAAEPFIVRNALEDERFSSNPLVLGDPFIRFYAGVPLILEDGAAVGSLCVIDTEARELAPHQLDALTRLARQVACELDLRRRLASSLEQSAPTMPGASLATVASDTLDQRPRTRTNETQLPVPLGSVLAGRFRLERVIAQGGMGLVVGGIDQHTHAPVAVKFMLAELARNDEGVERFVREARALIKMESEHIARVLDIGNLAGGAPFIVMEALEGEDLAHRLWKRGPMPWESAVELVVAVCAAVAFAHEHGVLHRDLKPANIFLACGADGRDTVKVLDFGISKLWSGPRSEAKVGLTQAAGMLGTPEYMAPEQMLSGADVDERADVWSLGVILYELIAGARPFHGDTLPQLCRQVMVAPLPALAERRHDVPAALCEAVARCLAKEPNDRIASARELAAVLRRIRTHAQR